MRGNVHRRALESRPKTRNASNRREFRAGRRLALLLDMLKPVLLLLALATAADAQPVSFGVKAGVPITEPTFPPDESPRYVIGPMIEVRLPAGFALEASALYQRLLSDAIYPGVFTIAALTGQTRANSWEFPVVGKYYFLRHRSWQPYVGTGWSLRTVTIHSRGSQTITDANGVTNTFPFKTDQRLNTDVGVVAAAGVRMHAGRLAVLPEFRYTYWGSHNNLIRRDDVKFLLGLSF